MNADLSSIAELARLSPAERKRCVAIAREIDAADAEPGAESTTRALRLRNRLQENLGIEVSERQIYRYLKAYGLAGMAGLADTRKTPVSRRSLTDPRVLDLVENELKEQLPASTGTRSRTIARVRWEAARHDIPVPSRRTMHRILEELDRNRGSFGPATTRRSKAIRPDRTFHPTAPSRPGEIVEIDATPLDVFVQMPDGLIARPELTYAIDVATGTIAATLLHANAAKSVDIGAVLLTRMLTRVADQPWWSSAVGLAEALFEPAEGPVRRRLEEAAALMPLIVPESVTVDRGKVFVGSVFTAACERLEISQTRANPRQATDKPHVEGGFKRIREGFVQYLAGYTGGNTANRGANPQGEAVWTLDEVQLLLNIWVITSWQTTAQSGLRLPGMPHRSLSPNQMYSALSAAAPQLPVSLSRDGYISLLPIDWRNIHDYGVNFDNLIYNADQLHPMRGRKSGLTGVANGRWELRYDPYDLRQVWVRDPANSRWITATWSLARYADRPFGRDALRSAQRALSGSGTLRPLDVLEQINRIQAQRVEHDTPATAAHAQARHSYAQTIPTPIVELRALEKPVKVAPKTDTAEERTALPPARLEILD